MLRRPTTNPPRRDVQIKSCLSKTTGEAAKISHEPRPNFKRIKPYVTGSLANSGAHCTFFARATAISTNPTTIDPSAAT